MVGGNVPLRMSLFVQVVIDYSHLDEKVTSWTVLGGGRQRAAPNVAVCASGNRLFTPRWESYFMDRFGWWHQNGSGSTFRTVRETLPYSKKLRNGAETFPFRYFINALKVFGVSDLFSKRSDKKLQNFPSKTPQKTSPFIHFQSFVCARRYRRRGSKETHPSGGW